MDIKAQLRKALADVRDQYGIQDTDRFRQVFIQTVETPSGHCLIVHVDRYDFGFGSEPHQLFSDFRQAIESLPDDQLPTAPYAWALCASYMLSGGFAPYRDERTGLVINIGGRDDQLRVMSVLMPQHAQATH